MRFHKRHAPTGARPGTLVIPEGAPRPRVRLIQYDEATIEERKVGKLEDIELGDGKVSWVDVQGLGSAKRLREIGARFGLHRLALADVVNVPQRPKTETYAEHMLIIARAALWERGSPPRFEQVAIVLGKDYVVTFREHQTDLLEPVVERLRAGGQPLIRRLGADYLAYSILDTIVDGYYPIEVRVADYLEQLEPRVLKRPVPEMLDRLAEVSAALVMLRRILVPQRAAVRAMLETKTSYISDDVQLYVRDTLDHSAQLVEGNESNRELSTGLMHTYLSVMSHRTNEVMKVLTIMASLFIPLTFVAGIYGMNFEAMPELHEPLGYPVVLVAMAVLAIGMLAYFRRRGWLGGERDQRDVEPLF